MTMHHIRTSLPTILLLATAGMIPACAADVGGEPTEESGEVGSVEQPIKNGQTTGFPELIEEVTVLIRTPQNGVCTGVVMSPYAVLTDRHCTTTDGTRTGPLAAVNTMRVISNGNTVTPNARVTHSNTDLDSAILFFNTPQTGLAQWDLNEFPPAFSQFYTPQLVNGYLRTAIKVDGYGGDPDVNCNDALHAGIERHGIALLDGYANSGREIVLSGPTLPIAGDSGSGYWYQDPNVYPQNWLVGVHRTGDCEGGVRVRARGTAAAAIADWVYDQIRQHMINIGASGVFIPGSTLANQGTAWTPYGATCSTAAWTVAGGWLREASNCGTAHGGALFVHDRTTLKNGGVLASVWSTDDDAIGVAFRIQSKYHYYAVEVNESSQRVYIRKVSNNTSTIVGSWSASVEHGGSRAPEVGAWAWGDSLWAHYNGTWYGPVRDSSYPNGGVGLYERYMSNAYFTNLRVIY